MIGGERQARFPGRPLPHQWWSAVLNVLPLLLLIYPSTGELWQQDFEPLAKPLSSKSPDSRELKSDGEWRSEWRSASAGHGVLDGLCVRPLHVYHCERCCATAWQCMGVRKCVRVGKCEAHVLYCVTL